MKKDKIIPDFKNENEEREFWTTHSPHQSLAKIYLARQISLERGSLHMASKKRGSKTTGSF